MQVHPRESARVIDLAAYRTATSARQLLASAMHLDTSIEDQRTREPFVVMFITDPVALILSPSLSNLEIRVAAWACAVRMARLGDPSVGYTHRRLREVVALMGSNPQPLFGARVDDVGNG